MRKVILLFTLTGLILLGCEKEKNTDETIHPTNPLICNFYKINNDSIVYKQFDSPLINQTRTEFSTTDSLFHDTIHIDINADDIADFLFYYTELYSKGPYYKEKDALFKYLAKQTFDIRANSKYLLAEYKYNALAMLPTDDMIDSVSMDRRNIRWFSFEGIPEPYTIPLFRHWCNIFS